MRERERERERERAIAIIPQKGKKRFSCKKGQSRIFGCESMRKKII